MFVSYLKRSLTAQKSDLPSFTMERDFNYIYIIYSNARLDSTTDEKSNYL